MDNDAESAAKRAHLRSRCLADMPITRAPLHELNATYAGTADKDTMILRACRVILKMEEEEAAALLEALKRDGRATLFTGPFEYCELKAHLFGVVRLAASADRPDAPISLSIERAAGQTG
jgi:hypothetical protein